MRTPKSSSVELETLEGFRGDEDDRPPVLPKPLVSKLSKAERARRFEEEMNSDAEVELVPRQCWTDCWKLLCCCIYTTKKKNHQVNSDEMMIIGGQDDHSKELVKAPFLWLWLLLLTTSWMPIAGAAIYAADHTNAPALEWYWCWPLLLIALAHGVTLLGYHVLYKAYGDEDYAYRSAGSDEATRFQSAVCNVLLVVFSATALMLSFVFASRDYWSQLLPNKQPVDSTPSVLALISTGMGLASLLFRLVYIYQMDREYLLSLNH